MFYTSSTHKIWKVNNEQRTNNTSATLTFTSWIRNIEYVYAGLDIVALTSLNEGTPVSIIEAQASGKPVISTTVGGVENIVIPGITALLSGDNHQSFFNNLLTIVDDDEIRLEMGKEGWNHVQQKFSYHRLISDMKGLYEKLLRSI